MKILAAICKKWKLFRAWILNRCIWLYRALCSYLTQLGWHTFVAGCLYCMDPEDYVVMLLFNGRYSWLSLIMNRLKPSGNYVYHLMHSLKSLNFSLTVYSFDANDSQHQKDYFPKHHSAVGVCIADGVFLCEVGTGLHIFFSPLALHNP